MKPDNKLQEADAAATAVAMMWDEMAIAAEAIVAAAEAAMKAEVAAEMKVKALHALKRDADV